MRYVYVIQSEAGPVKIGISTDCERRLYEIKRGLNRPMSVVFHIEAGDDRADRVERKAHEMLQKFRLYGEWFNVSAEMAIDVVKQADKATPLHAPKFITLEIPVCGNTERAPV